MTAPARKARQEPRLPQQEASAIEALAGMFAELRRDVHELREEVSELRDGRARSAWPAPEGFVDLKTAAAESRRNVEAVRLWCASGKIAGTRRINGKWYVRLSDVLTIAEALGAFGPPTPKRRGPVKVES
jgi:hypothetical protein